MRPNSRENRQNRQADLKRLQQDDQVKKELPRRFERPPRGREIAQNNLRGRPFNLNEGRNLEERKDQRLQPANLLDQGQPQRQAQANFGRGQPRGRGGYHRNPREPDRKSGVDFQRGKDEKEPQKLYFKYNPIIQEIKDLQAQLDDETLERDRQFNKLAETTKTLLSAESINGFQKYTLLTNFLSLTYNIIEKNHKACIYLTKAIIEKGSLDQQSFKFYVDNFNSMNKGRTFVPTAKAEEICQHLIFWMSYYKFALSKALGEADQLDPNTQCNFVNEFALKIISNISNPKKPDQISLKETYMKLQMLVLEVKQLHMIYQQEQPRQKYTDLNQDDIDSEGERIIIPRDDFRRLSVAPTLEDFELDDPEFLEEIETHRAFRDAENYLEVNFRLVREDYFHDVREAIKILRSGEGLDDLRYLINYFDDTYIEGHFASEEFFGFCFKINVGLPRNGQFIQSWSFSNKLKFGNLVLFSEEEDGFQQNIHLGIIRYSDPRQMDQTQRKHGFVQIYIEHLVQGGEPTTELYHRLKNKKIWLAESKTYYEAYCHVLNALQSYPNRNEDPDEPELPLEDLIVFLRKDQNTTPHYLTDVGLFDHSASKNQFIREAGFDTQQEAAFRHVFSTRLSIVKGPPGTGKTHVGVKIVEFLLKNLRQHPEDTGFATGPIMLTCYTNHALDQFLEKILGKTQSIIRLGGQTKNEDLKKYNLANFRKINKIRLKPEHREAIQEYKEISQKFSFINNNIMSLQNLPIALKVPDNLLNEVLVEFNKTLNTALQENGFYQTLNINFFVKIYQEVVKNIQDGEKYKIMQVTSQMVGDQDEQQAVKFAKYLDEIFHSRGIANTLEWLGVLDWESLWDSYEEYLSSNDNHDWDDEIELEDFFNDYVSEYQDIKDHAGNSIKIQNLLKSCYWDNDDWNDYANYSQVFRVAKQRYNIKYAQNLRKLVHVYKQNFNKPYIDVWSFNIEVRWIIALGLAETIQNLYSSKINHMARQVRQADLQLKQYQRDQDAKILRQVKIIGMTTTGAAKYKPLLKKVPCKIVIVEEAAEVLESHITTSLPDAVEHVVLIGDEQQLRPSLNVMKLGEKYNLDISMFERLINNDFEFVQLCTQRRMRDAISVIVREIYPSIKDDKSVLNRPNIRGIASGNNYYFFDHSFKEEQQKGSMSWSNPQEALMILRFTLYLLAQKYKAEKITILSLYTGQLLTFKTLVKKLEPRVNDKSKKVVKEVIDEKEEESYLLRNVQIKTVDNYQGEENDIIILSLVRSNEKNQIGFLKISNRVTVALSRARNGMYVFGNASTLRLGAKGKFNNQVESQQHLWLKVLKILKDRGDIGKTLTLKCDSHDHATEITNPEDFDNVPEGGCHQICNQRMPCGHPCRRFCHYTERTKEDPTGHGNIICKQPCQRKRANCDHKCTHLCQTCKYGEHDGITDENGIFLGGHHTLCKVPVEQELKCGHTIKVVCHLKDQVECDKPCEKTVYACGHPCRYPCSKDCYKIYDNDRKRGFITPCNKLRLKTLPCPHNHQKEIPCGQTEQAHYEREGCQELVMVKLNCGHESWISCDEAKNKPRSQFKCQQPCGALLECGHPCPNRCHQCFGKIFHGTCKSKCNRILFCNHKCSEPCGNYCPPCTKPCNIRCSHSVCTMMCGEPCHQCTEQCDIQCEHSKCSKLCHEICDREPCKLPCKKKLDCGHPCIGFCGEICPKACRVQGCPNHENHKEYFDIMLSGDEYNEDARFVVLPDCKNKCILEESALLRLFDIFEKGEKIQHPKCPICQTVIQNCNRVQDKLKTIYKAVNHLKRTLKAKVDQAFDSKVLKQKIHNLTRLYQRNAVSHFQEQVGKIIEVSDENLDKLDVSLTLRKTIVASIDIAINFLEWFNGSQLMVAQQVTENLKGILVQVFDQISSGKPLHKNRLIKIAQIYEAFSLVMRISIHNKYNDQKLIEIKNKLIQCQLVVDQEEFERLSKQANQINRELTPQEKYDIQQAVQVDGITAGHWYKCPKGHHYLIDRCGGAMETSQCPECQEQIGGSNHRLLGNNQQSDFAGATVSAYDADIEYARQLQRELNN